MKSKVSLTDEQWEAMLPAILRIDGGCGLCIYNFLSQLAEAFELNQEMLGKIRIAGATMRPDEVKEILDIERLTLVENMTDNEEIKE